MGPGGPVALSSRSWLRLRRLGRPQLVPADYLPGVFAPRGEYFTSRRSCWLAPNRCGAVTSKRRRYVRTLPVAGRLGEVVGRTAREPSFLSCSCLLPLTACAPIVVGRADRHPGC